MPVLPGQGSTPRIFDSATQQMLPAPSGGLYVCGITPYDATHLGHAATYVAYDTLVRVWRDAGGEPVYIQNVTDIDDPLLERAEATGVTWAELAESQTDLYRSDMEALNVIPPTHYRGVVESMDLIIAGVSEMLDEGAAYWVGEDLYADLSADANYGIFCHYDHDAQMSLFAERGGDPHTPGKRDPLDPLLWLGARPGEPTWDGGRLGLGRPGWHIECAVIAREYLEVPFNVQGGGEDLTFPHHEMSLSHLRILTGAQQPATVRMHAALLEYEGEKMSKSLGNLVFVSGLRGDGVDPAAIRLLLLGQHYRHAWEYSTDKLETASRRLAQWRAAITEPTGSTESATVGAGEPGGMSGVQALEQIRAHLAEDLDTPSALKVVDEWVEQGRRGEEDCRLMVNAVDALFGVKGLRGYPQG